jgi:oxygen-independent coproporphyrinogen-3 oxidase
MCSPQAKPSSLSDLGIYCHIPFCASTCDFCAFYQEAPKRAEIERFLAGMLLEFEQLPVNCHAQTIFWGGGTPGLLPAKDLLTLGEALLSRLSSPPAEWTVEMAPSTVKLDKLQVLRDLGVTRISMGVQSFDEQTLSRLGRLHQPKQIFTAWERIQSIGFAHSNMDLMFAIPGQTQQQWLDDIAQAIALGPDHISTYCLTFEEDTRLYLKLARGEVRRSEEQEVTLLEAGWQALAQGGFEQYEISNFARPGGACQHNINTWRMTEWIGCGPSAASQHHRRRYQNPSDLKLWLEQLESAQGATPAEVILLDDRQLATDALIFGLRMNEGVDLAALAKRYPQAAIEDTFNDLFLDLENEGYLVRKVDQVQLSHAGRLVCDAIGAGLLEASTDPDSYSES